MEAVDQRCSAKTEHLFNRTPIDGCFCAGKKDNQI